MAQMNRTGPASTSADSRFLNSAAAGSTDTHVAISTPGAAERHWRGQQGQASMPQFKGVLHRSVGRCRKVQRDSRRR
jgi:hypothetical protein